MSDFDDLDVSTGSQSVQHTEKTFTYTEPRWSDSAGSEASTTMNIANFTTGRGRRGERWYMCGVCLKELPESEVLFFDGLPLCKACHADYVADERKR